MSCSRNDVVLLPIPFTDLTSRKVRPAIIVGRKGTDLFLLGNKNESDRYTSQAIQIVNKYREFLPDGRDHLPHPARLGR